MFTGSMHTTTTLGNGTNKSRLIAAISSILDQTGITVAQTTSDADTFVSTALELADSGEAVDQNGHKPFGHVSCQKCKANTKLFLLAVRCSRLSGIESRTCFSFTP